MSDNFDEHDWRRFLKSLGEDPDRPGLIETPARVAKAWKHWSSGYGQNPADVLKAFEDGAEEYNELIVVRNIPVYSHCEHHLAPFFGKATVGYMPDGKIVGLSKLTRLVECFAKRLQVQERLTIQVANALMESLQPKAVGVVIRCRHLCMESRGIKTAGEETVVSYSLIWQCVPNFFILRAKIWVIGKLSQRSFFLLGRPGFFNRQHRAATIS
ncbi:MAG: cyclohydrolase FolE [Pseudomonadota bacterium]